MYIIHHVKIFGMCKRLIPLHVFAFSELTVMFQKMGLEKKEYCPSSNSLWTAYADSKRNCNHYQVGYMYFTCKSAYTGY